MTENATPIARRVVRLSHRIHAGLVTYPGLPAPVIRPFLTREDSVGRYAEGTTFAMDVIEMIGNTALPRLALPPYATGRTWRVSTSRRSSTFPPSSCTCPSRRRAGFR